MHSPARPNSAANVADQAGQWGRNVEKNMLGLDGPLGYCDFSTYLCPMFQSHLSPHLVGPIAALHAYRQDSKFLGKNVEVRNHLATTDQSNQECESIAPQDILLQLIEPFLKCLTCP